jgi:hypothetical protein
MLFQSLHHSIWVLAMFGISGFALWRGGQAERLVAAGNLIAWAASLFMQDTQDWFDPQTGILLVDIAFLGFLVWVALTHDRTWLLFAAAFQFLGVVTHLASVADTGVRNLAYLRSLAIWSYLILLTLAIGAYTARPRPVAQS